MNTGETNDTSKIENAIISDLTVTESISTFSSTLGGTQTIAN